MITVTLHDGSTVNYPDATDADVVNGALVLSRTEEIPDQEKMEDRQRQRPSNPGNSTFGKPRTRDINVGVHAPGMWSHARLSEAPPTP